jgi:hypothetical protein
VSGSEAVDLVREVLAARQRLIEFVGRCPDAQWSARPLADDDPRTVGVIVDHVADAYEYLGSFVVRLLGGEPVAVSPEIVDDLNARHSSALRSPSRPATLDHLARSGDAFVALVSPLSAYELSTGDGRVTVARFAEIAARHADAHRAELETALGLTT